MLKKIGTIGLTIQGGQTTQIPLSSKASLLDYDIIIVDPKLDSLGFCFLGGDQYQGKSCLSDSGSFQLREHAEHWRREILEAIRAGKTVFVLLNSKEEIYVATGEKTYSGTGRNRHTTREVMSYSNYQMIPGLLDLGAVNSKGTSMRLSERADVLAGYWRDFGEESEYRILLEGIGSIPLVVTKSGNKTVGGELRLKASGVLLLNATGIVSFPTIQDVDALATDEIIADS